MLGRRIQELCREKSACFELLGLEPCVKLLRARKTWSRDCDALRTEIVSFAREQTGTAAANHEVIIFPRMTIFEKIAAREIPAPHRS